MPVMRVEIIGCTAASVPASSAETPESAMMKPATVPISPSTTSAAANWRTTAMRLKRRAFSASAISSGRIGARVQAAGRSGVSPSSSLLRAALILNRRYPQSARPTAKTPKMTKTRPVGSASASRAIQPWAPASPSSAAPTILTIRNRKRSR